jgi:hypothetical protein
VNFFEPMTTFSPATAAVAKSKRKAHAVFMPV